MSETRRRKAAAIRRLLETEGDAVFENASLLNDQRYEAIERFDRFEALRDDARAIKEDAIERLPELVELVQERVEASGGTVHVADDAAAANQYIEKIVEQTDAESVVKSKSMTTEEIEVNEHLEALGVEVVETDLGEFVLQVADEAPSHLIAPAIHRSTKAIARLFEEQFDPERSLETAEDLTRFARDHVGEHIREADLGMTGANFVLAESGTIVLVTNEGNARKTAVTPDVHVAVAGIEKLIPSVRDLGPFVELIARTGTGQDITQYVSLLSPPTESPTIDFDAGEPIRGGAEDREFHLVLLDNGRTAMRDDQHLRETLYCIRCGACANSCANFQHVGGHAFGGETYTGGIATGWEAGVAGLETAAEFNDLCTGCSRCVNACPVKIDIPWINTVVRDRVNRGGDPDTFDFLVDGLIPDAEPAGTALEKRFFGNVEVAARLASATAPVSNWLAGTRPVRALLDRVVGLDRRRELPQFERETLHQWYRERGSRVTNADRELVLYPDLYTNYVHTNRGKAAVRVLEALGVEVHIPALPESGRAPLSQGMIETATERAQALASTLEGHVADGRDVVVIEPSDLAMFRREYTKLLSESTFDRLSGATFEILEYVFGLLEEGVDSQRLTKGDGTPVSYHGHCQARTVGVDTYTEAVLDRLGYEVETSDVECCGMAGSFGYKTAYYELSVDVGEPLAVQLAGAEEIVASGTSCLEQIEELLGRSARHPIELLDPDAA